jgi:hypothetical protein
MLKFYSANLDDIQHLRIIIKNRNAAAVRLGLHDFGQEDGISSGLEKVENAAKSTVEQAYRHAVSPGVMAWQQSMGGVGELQLGRLLGVIGHPRIAVPKRFVPNPRFKEDEPSSLKNPKRLLIVEEPRERTLDQLRSYCGLGDPARKHTKGMSAEEALRCGSPQAKVMVHRIITQCRMSAPAGYYTELARANKKHYMVTHPEWKPGHNDMAAIRRTAKSLLRDLYDAAADWQYS